mmetsp:Transcript_9023/g.16774  ORF Transcript_9023/g.16774 Transcript_9023/m.16774 type:complete len:279 (+) Transcript_9023:1593-2429(+)
MIAAVARHPGSGGSRARGRQDSEISASAKSASASSAKDGRTATVAWTNCSRTRPLSHSHLLPPPKGSPAELSRRPPPAGRSAAAGPGPAPGRPALGLRRRLLRFPHPPPRPPPFPSSSFSSASPPPPPLLLLSVESRRPAPAAAPMLSTPGDKPPRRFERLPASASIPRVRLYSSPRSSSFVRRLFRRRGRARPVRRGHIGGVVRRAPGRRRTRTASSFDCALPSPALRLFRSQRRSSPGNEGPPFRRNSPRPSGSASPTWDGASSSGNEGWPGPAPR